MKRIPQRKYRKLLRMQRHLPMARAKILEAIPQVLWERLTAAELVAVMDALNTHWHEACAWKERQILAEGCIWDPAAGHLIEIARPGSARSA